MLRAALIALVLASVLAFASAVDHHLRFVYTGYVHGGLTLSSYNGTFCPLNGRGERNDVDPNCMGGCARRQGVIEAVRDEFPETVTVDIGGYMWGSIYYNTFGATAAIDCFNRTKYDVAGLAGSDLYASPSDLKAFLEAGIEKGTPFVMTNGRLGANENSPLYGLAKRSAIHTLPDGKRIGFVSILNPKFSMTTTLPPGEIIVNPSGGSQELDIRLEIARLRRTENVDYIVLMGTYEETRPLDYVLQFADVDIVLLARSYAPSGYPRNPEVLPNLFGEEVVVGFMGNEFGIDVGFLDLKYVDGVLDIAHFKNTGYAYPSNFPFKKGSAIARLEPMMRDHTTGIPNIPAPTSLETHEHINEKYNLLGIDSFVRVISTSKRGISGDSGIYASGGANDIYGCRWGPCPMGRLIADAFASRCPDLPSRGCIALLNAGGIRSSFFPPTSESVSDMEADNEYRTLEQWAEAAAAAAALEAAQTAAAAAANSEMRARWAAMSPAERSALTPLGHSQHPALVAERGRANIFTSREAAPFAPRPRLTATPSPRRRHVRTASRAEDKDGSWFYDYTNPFWPEGKNGNEDMARDHGDLMNPTEWDGSPFPVRAVDAFQVLPFTNTVGFVRVRGSSVRRILGISLEKGPNGRVLQHNLNVVYNQLGPVSSHEERILDVRVPVGVGSVPVGTVNMDGWVPLVDDAEYTIVTNAYLIEGNDGFNESFRIDFPDSYVDTGLILSNVLADYMSERHAAGVPLDYPTMEDDAACSTRDPLAPVASSEISDTADCRGIRTLMSHSAYNRCPTSLSFCANRNGETLFDSLRVDASKCDQCSSLGVCVDRSCVCSGIYTLPSTHPNGDPVVVNVVAGAPDSGPWKGIVLVEGPACSKVRSVWHLSPGHRAAIATPGALTALVSLVAIGAVAFWRQHPVMKALTPFLAGMQCMGGIIGSISILADAAYENDVTCTLAVWALCIGFTLLIGTMVVKLHRIKQIITAAQLQAKVAYTELQALGGVMILFAVNLIVLIVYTAHEPARMIPKALTTEFAVGDFCKSDERVYTTTFLTFNAVILVAGLYLALRTRNETANFSECKFLGFSLFNTAFMVLVTFVVTFVVSKYDPTVSIIARAWLVFYIVVTTLGLIFIPRVLLILRGVTEVESYQAKASSLSSGEAQKQSARDKRTIQTLSHRLRGRRNQVRERDEAIAASTALLTANGLAVPRYDPLVEIPTEDWDPDDPAAAAAALGTSNVGSSGANTTNSGAGVSSGETEMQPLTVGLPQTSSNGVSGRGPASPTAASGANAGGAVRRPMFGHGPAHGRGTTRFSALASTGAAGDRVTSPPPGSHQSPPTSLGFAASGASSGTGTGGTVIIPRTASPAMRSGSPAVRSGSPALRGGPGASHRASLNSAGGAVPHRSSLGGGTVLYPTRSQSSVRRSHRGSGAMYHAASASAAAAAAGTPMSPSPVPTPVPMARTPAPAQTTIAAPEPVPAAPVAAAPIMTEPSPEAEAEAEASVPASAEEEGVPPPPADE